MDGLTVWLPLTDLLPDQAPEAVQATGAVALELLLQFNVVLWPAVIDVEEAEKVSIGAIGDGAGGGVGVGAGDGVGDGVGFGLGAGVGEGEGDGVVPVPLPFEPLPGIVPLVELPADVPVDEPAA